MASGRMHNLGDIHMVTNRCEEGRYFLLPATAVNEIICYWFTRTLASYGDGIEVYAFCFLSNHFHILLKDTKGTLAKFMGIFQSNVGKAINREIGRGPAHFWQGHYDDQIIKGDKTFWNKYVYVLTNAVKSGLVGRTEDWDGLNSFEAALTGKPIKGEGLNRTNYHKATRGNVKHRKSEFEETYELHISPPPMLEDMSQKERKKEIYRMVKHAEVHYLSRRDTKAILGMAKSTKRKRFACDTIEKEKEMINR